MPKFLQTAQKFEIDIQKNLHLPQTDQNKATPTMTSLIIKTAEEGTGNVRRRRETATAIVRGSRQYPSVHTLWKNELWKK